MRHNDTHQSIVVMGDAERVDSVRQALPHTEFTIISAADAHEAIQLYESSAPDFIMLASDSPGIDGLTIARRIRAGGGPQPFILMWLPVWTGDAVREALQAGADDCITHPIEPELLHRRLRNLMHNLAYHQAIKQREHEYDRLMLALSESSAAINSSLELETILARILQAVENVVSADSSNVMFIDDEGYALIKLHHSNRKRDILENAALGLNIKKTDALKWICEQKRALLIPNVRDFEGWVMTREDDWIRCYMGAPLMEDGRVIGFINLNGAQVNQFNERHLQYLQAFAAQASIAIHNARLYGQVQDHAAELERRVMERTAQLSSMNQSLQQQMDARQRIEKALAEERNLLRALINGLPDQIYVKDLESRFTLANAITKRRMPPKMRNRSIIGLTDFDIYPEHQAQQWYEEEQRIFETGIPVYNRETQWIDEDTGRKRTLLVSKLPLYDHKAQIYALLGINRDITDLRQAEDDLAHIIASANCLLWYADVIWRDGEFHWDTHITSESAARRFMPLAMEVGQSYESAWNQAIFPEDMAGLRKHTDAALLEGATSYAYEARIRRADGHPRWLLFDVQITQLREAHWSLVGVCTDITSRRTLEEILRQSNELLERRVQTRTAELAATAEQLRESEEKYRTLTNQLPVGIYRVNAEYKVQYANKALAQMLGIDEPEKLIGDSAHLYWLNSEASHAHIMRRLPPPNVARQDEFQLLRRDGHLIWVRHTWHALYDEDGHLLSIDGSLEDITTRKLAQLSEYEQRTFAEALAEAAANLNSTLELDDLLDRIMEQISRVMPQHESDEIILLEDPNIANIIRFRRITPEGVETTPYQASFELSLIPNLEYMRDFARSRIVTDALEDSTWKLVPGTEWIRSFVGVPILSDGEVIGFINLSSKQPNVFDDKDAARLMAFANQVGIAIKNARLYARVQRAAQDLRMQVEERTEALSRQTALLNTILNAMSEGVIYYDANRQPVFSNRSMSELTGLSETGFFSFDVVDRMFVQERNAAEDVRLNIRNAFARNENWQGEVRLRRRSGEEFDASLSVTRVFGIDQSSRGSVAVLRDISSEKEMEEQRRRFIAYASHELRTPITNLSTRLYLMRKQPERIQDHMQVMESVITRMKQLTEDLLDLSRIEKRALTLNRRVVNLNELVNEITQLEVPEAALKNISLAAVLPDAPVYVSIDTARMWRVLVNLVTNAINYTERGGEITLEVQREQGRAKIMVSDTGTGIAPDILPDIFKLFVRGKIDNSGSGLGLTIVRELVELHGGTIHVESELDKGTTFTIWLDAEPEPPQDEPKGTP